MRGRLRGGRPPAGRRRSRDRRLVPDPAGHAMTAKPEAPSAGLTRAGLDQLRRSEPRLLAAGPFRGGQLATIRGPHDPGPAQKPRTGSFTDPALKTPTLPAAR